MVAQSEMINCAMSDQPDHIARLIAADDDFGSRYAELVDDSLDDGELPTKTKLLMLLALDAAGGFPEAVNVLADEAREQGATEEEIRETVEVVAMARGTQGLATVTNAFEDFRFDL